MSSIIRRSRYRSAIALVAVLVGLLVVWEHSGEPTAHMEEVGSICLAVISTASLLAVTPEIAWSLPTRARRPAAGKPLSSASFQRPAPLPASRAGPAMLQVIRR